MCNFFLDISGEAFSFRLTRLLLYKKKFKKPQVKKENCKTKRKKNAKKPTRLLLLLGGLMSPFRRLLGGLMSPYI